MAAEDYEASVRSGHSNALNLKHRMALASFPDPPMVRS
jgi:hypothetical protein